MDEAEGKSRLLEAAGFAQLSEPCMLEVVRRAREQAEISARTPSRRKGRLMIGRVELWQSSPQMWPFICRPSSRLATARGILNITRLSPRIPPCHQASQEVWFNQPPLKGGVGLRLDVHRADGIRGGYATLPVWNPGAQGEEGGGNGIAGNELCAPQPETGTGWPTRLVGRHLRVSCTGRPRFPLLFQGDSRLDLRFPSQGFELQAPGPGENYQRWVRDALHWQKLSQRDVPGNVAAESARAPHDAQGLVDGRVGSDTRTRLAPSRQTWDVRGTRALGGGAPENSSHYSARALNSPKGNRRFRRNIEVAEGRYHSVVHRQYGCHVRSTELDVAEFGNDDGASSPPQISVRRRHHNKSRTSPIGPQPVSGQAVPAPQVVRLPPASGLCQGFTVDRGERARLGKEVARGGTCTTSIGIHPLAVRKANREGFKGVMLIPHWPKRLWWPELQHVCSMYVLKPDAQSARQWRGYWQPSHQEQRGSRGSC